MLKDKYIIVEVSNFILFSSCLFLLLPCAKKGRRTEQTAEEGRYEYCPDFNISLSIH